MEKDKSTGGFFPVGLGAMIPKNKIVTTKKQRQP